MSESEPAKSCAAEAAAALVEGGMKVGLGSGTTASLVVQRLGERVRQEGLHFIGVSSSEATAALARSVGIELKEIDDVDALDLNLDGADEIDRRFRMTKGRGGALLREKIVATAARRHVAVVTASKLVERLGSTMPVPVEVSPFGLRHTDQALRALGAVTTLRLGPGGAPYQTDGGNAIIDCRFAAIDDPLDLDHRLHRVVGVFETGLFIGLCDQIIVGHDDHAELVERPG
jgi:ribose 5-phosphate isomerase A